MLKYLLCKKVSLDLYKKEIKPYMQNKCYCNKKLNNNYYQCHKCYEYLCYEHYQKAILNSEFYGKKYSILCDKCFINGY